MVWTFNYHLYVQSRWKKTLLAILGATYVK